MQRRIRWTVLAVAVLAASVWAQDEWVLGPEKRLPAFRQPERVAGAKVRQWDFAPGSQEWQPRSETVALSHAPDTGRTAPGCLRVGGFDDGNWNFVWSPRFEVKPGKSYRADLWLRVEAEPAQSPATYYMKVQLFRTGGGGVSVSSNRLPSTVTGKWQELSVEFTVPKDFAGNAALALEKGGRDRASVAVSIDDVRVEETSGEAAERIWRDAILRGPITKELRGQHPRLYLNPARLASLRKAVTEDERWRALLAELVRQAEKTVRTSPPDYAKNMKNYRKGKPAGSHEQLWQRGVGNRIPTVALAYLLTDDERYLDAAKTWLFAALEYPTWSIGGTEGIDLAAGHLLAGIGLGYDWLYHDLSPEERQRIRDLVVPRAEKLARAGFERRAFWHSSYLQNHLWVSLGGAATTAFAMADEVPEAASWICLAHAKFIRTLEELGDDGASQEGYGYWEYGAEYIMRYLELADTCLGIDLYTDSQSRPHPWFSQNAAYAVHLALPRDMWTRQRSVVNLADCPTNHWYGPSYLLRNLARRYPDSPWQGSAQHLAAEFERAGVDNTSSGHALNFAWYDSTIPAQSPQATKLPLAHHFRDLDIVSARTSWASDATHLVVKCGPPLGHKHATSGKNYGAGHTQPDAGHFVLAAGGEVLFRDSGYTHHKHTGNHSSLLVNGQGQKGGGKKWLDYGPWLKDSRAPRILAFESTPKRDVIRCDVAPAYPPELGLQRFERQFEFSHPDRLLIRDNVATAAPAELEWRFHVEGSLERISDLEWRTTMGNVSAIIRLEATVPISSQAGALEIDTHIRPRQGNYLSVRTKDKTRAATLATRIRVVIPE